MFLLRDDQFVFLHSFVLYLFHLVCRKLFLGEMDVYAYFIDFVLIEFGEQ